MPFVTPVVFTAATAVSATSLQTNHTALRKYINHGIIQADILPVSVTTTDIVRGEYANVVRDHQFTTGDILTQFVEVDLFSHTYATSHFKSYDLYSLKTEAIPNMSKRVIMERDGTIFFSAGMAAIGDANYELTPDKKATGVYVQISLNDRVIATDYIPATKGRAYTEDGVTGDGDTSGNTTVHGIYSRRWYAQRYWRTFNKGDIVNIALVVDPRSDKMHITARNLNLEVFYR
jgi:hypothetical protein